LNLGKSMIPYVGTCEAIKCVGCCSMRQPLSSHKADFRWDAFRHGERINEGSQMM